MINENVKARLREYKVFVDDGVTFLLALHYGFKPNFFPDELQKKMNICKFYERDGTTGTLKWLMPLFDQQVTGFDWVKDWMEMFAEINPERKGVVKYVMPRMKKFFVENPDVRKEEVIGATKMYFRNVTAPMYLKSSQKFIMEGKGADKYSMLEEWVEKYRNWQGVQEGRTSFNNTMN